MKVGMWRQGVAEAFSERQSSQRTTFKFPKFVLCGVG